MPRPGRARPRFGPVALGSGGDAFPGALSCGPRSRVRLGFRAAALRTGSGSDPARGRAGRQRRRGAGRGWHAHLAAGWPPPAGGLPGPQASARPPGELQYPQLPPLATPAPRALDCLARLPAAGSPCVPRRGTGSPPHPAQQVCQASEPCARAAGAGQKATEQRPGSLPLGRPREDAYAPPHPHGASAWWRGGAPLSHFTGTCQDLTASPGG